MKKSFYLTTTIILISLFGITSCRSTILKKHHIGRWLQARQSQPAAIDISGFWKDARGDGWAKGLFKQEGNDLSGSLGPYMIKGIVTGKTVYLVLIYQGRTDFIFRMTPEGNKMLNGQYFRNHKLKDGVPVLLESEKPIKNK